MIDLKIIWFLMIESLKDWMEKQSVPWGCTNLPKRLITEMAK